MTEKSGIVCIQCKTDISDKLGVEYHELEPNTHICFECWDEHEAHIIAVANAEIAEMKSLCFYCGTLDDLHDIGDKSVCMTCLAKETKPKTTGLADDIAEFRSYVTCACDKFDDILRYHQAGAFISPHNRDLKVVALRLNYRLFIISKLIEDSSPRDEDLYCAINNIKDQLKRVYLTPKNGGQHGRGFQKNG